MRGINRQLFWVIKFTGGKEGREVAGPWEDTGFSEAWRMEGSPSGGDGTRPTHPSKFRNSMGFL